MFSDPSYVGCDASGEKERAGEFATFYFIYLSHEPTRIGSHVGRSDWWSLNHTLEWSLPPNFHFLVGVYFYLTKNIPEVVGTASTIGHCGPVQASGKTEAGPAAVTLSCWWNCPACSVPSL